MKYSADITAGSLKVTESRIIADLLLNGVTKEEFKKAVVDENILQARSGATAIRLARLIKKRLELMTPELWKLVRDGAGETATHAVLASAVKHSRLLGDFLDQVVREQFRIFNPILSNKLWDEYLNDCQRRDPAVATWKEGTRKRLSSSVFQMLAQAGYIESTKTRKLQNVHIATPVMKYLERNNEKYVLRCIQVTP